MQICALPKAGTIALCIKYAIHSNLLAYSYISFICQLICHLHISIRTYIFLPSFFLINVRDWFVFITQNLVKMTRKLMREIWNFDSILLIIIINKIKLQFIYLIIINFLNNFINNVNRPVSPSPVSLIGRLFH